MASLQIMHSSVTVKTTSTSHLLWSKCPLPKWNCQKSHQGYPRTSQKVLASC
ncbi:hypothetical protein ACHAXS_000566, partial [Conticribra weissflogii]